MEEQKNAQGTKRKRNKVQKTPFLLHLGTKIQQLRKAQNLSQEKLAYNVGLHPTYIGTIERGERNFTVDLLDRFANYFNIQVSELVK